MRLVAPWGSVVCPFCFTSFHLSQAARRSMSPAAPKEPDTRLGTFLSIPPPEMPKVEIPAASVWSRIFRRCVVSEDRSKEWRAVCPNCHLHLPHKTATGELVSEVIAIIGTRNSGKSNYFGVLIHALERRYAGEVGFQIFNQETFSTREMKPVSSKKLYRERYGDRLFESAERRAVDQTLSAATNIETRIPLIYRLAFPKRLTQYVTRPLAYVNAMDSSSSMRPARTSMTR